MNRCVFFIFTGCLIYSTIASSFPAQLLISQEKRFLPQEVSSYVQHVNVLIKTGAPTETEKKLPSELFIVLDSSGSMAGAEKWNNAILAIEHIIRSMNTGDKLHLVQYNSGSSVIFENSDDQSAMLKALHTVYPGGGTNLMAGFDQVIPLLKKYADRSTVKRLFIFSDGQINEGVTNHGQLLQEVTSIKLTYDVTICSFGIGYDFDEKLMTHIADHGSGDYFFIKGAESMEKVVGIAYRGFQNLMGTNAYLKVLTKYDARLVDVYGYERKVDDEQIIPIGNLRYNDVLNILLETNVKINEEMLEQEEIDYMVVELWMTDVTDRAVKLVATETVLLSLSRNDDELKELNEVVLGLVELQKIQRREREVTKLLQEKNVEAARTFVSASTAGRKTQFNILSSAPMADVKDQLVFEYAEKQMKSAERRSAEMLQLIDEMSDETDKLAMASSYYQTLNEKHSHASEDL